MLRKILKSKILKGIFVPKVSDYNTLISIDKFKFKKIQYQYHSNDRK